MFFYIIRHADLERRNILKRFFSLVFYLFLDIGREINTPALVR